MFPSILIQLENGQNEFYFYFVLRPELVAKKIGETKKTKNDGLTSPFSNTFFHKVGGVNQHGLQ